MLAILGIITSLMLFQYRRFDSQLLVRNLAYEIALTIREAQTLGIGVRGSAGVFANAHGVHFATGTAYFLFRDTNDNGRYNSGDAILNTYTVERKSTISNLCVGSAPLSGGECSRSSLDIMFERPDPDALFCYTGASSCPTGSAAQITVTSSTGITRTIDVTATGQVSIQ